MNEFSSKTSLDKIVQDTLISIEKYQHLLNGYGLYNGLGSVLLFMVRRICVRRIVASYAKLRNN